MFSMVAFDLPALDQANSHDFTAASTDRLRGVLDVAV